MQKNNALKAKVIMTKTAVGAAYLAMLMVGDVNAADIGLAASIGGDDSAIAIPIRTEGYLIQPELSYGFREDKYDGRNSESESWSLGVFGYKRVAAADNLEALFGVGLGYGNQEYDESYSSGYYQGSADGYFIAPAVALSYSVSDNISFSIEARYRFDSQDQERKIVDSDPYWTQNESDKSELKSAYTDTRVTLRYYFAGI